MYEPTIAFDHGVLLLGSQHPNGFRQGEFVHYGSFQRQC